MIDFSLPTNKGTTIEGKITISLNGSRGFKDWASFDHPTLGEVEIGGFHPKFFSQNGPAWQLEKWAKKQALFNLAMTMELPQITLDDVSIKKLKGNKYQIDVKISNSGKLPVALKQAQLVKIVKEDRLVLSFDENLTKGYEQAKVTIETPELFDKTIYLGYTEPGQAKKGRFVVTLNGIDGAKGILKVLSTRGGYIEEEIILGSVDE